MWDDPEIISVLSPEKYFELLLFSNFHNFLQLFTDYETKFTYEDLEFFHPYVLNEPKKFALAFKTFENNFTPVNIIVVLQIFFWINFSFLPCSTKFRRKFENFSLPQKFRIFDKNKNHSDLSAHVHQSAFSFQFINYRLIIAQMIN